MFTVRDPIKLNTIGERFQEQSSLFRRRDYRSNDHSHKKTVRNSSPYQDALCISNYLYNIVTYSVAPEPKVSSPHSQQSETGSYPEFTESTLHFQPISKSSILIHLPSTPRSIEWSFSFGLSHQIVHFSLLSHVRYTGPPHSS
jgi:hypothetical protein